MIESGALSWRREEARKKRHRDHEGEGKWVRHEGVQLEGSEAGYVQRPDTATEEHLAESPAVFVDAETYREQRGTYPESEPYAHGR